MQPVAATKPCTICGRVHEDGASSAKGVATAGTEEHQAPKVQTVHDALKIFMTYLSFVTLRAAYVDYKSKWAEAYGFFPTDEASMNKVLNSIEGDSEHERRGKFAKAQALKIFHGRTSHCAREALPERRNQQGRSEPGVEKGCLKKCGI